MCYLTRHFNVRVFPENHTSCNGIKPKIKFFRKSVFKINIIITLKDRNGKVLSLVYASVPKVKTTSSNNNMKLLLGNIDVQFVPVGAMQSADFHLQSYPKRSCRDRSFLLAEMIENDKRYCETNYQVLLQ
ncbi:hypothetical protein MXB_5000 [Myxobolus squamalis]|nr:hypothetical protein MXB_5000 [Myxobolus squamalis]